MNAGVHAKPEKRESFFSYLLGLWYAISAPPPPPLNASFEKREMVRRGKLGSVILLITLVIVASFLPAAIFLPDKKTLLGIGLTLLFMLLAVYLNRRGLTTLAGVLVIASINIGLINFFIFIPSNFSMIILPAFDMFVISELIAVSFLAPASVFLVALFNSVFMVVDVLFQPVARNLALSIPGAKYEIVLGPISLQLLVALVLYLWVKSAVNAIKRADRAEEIAALEQREVQQRRQLDEGIQKILATHVQVANGNFAARAPLNKDNVLWQIAHSLNNLLARLQSLSNADHELQRTRVVANQFIQMLQAAKRGEQPLHFSRTGTFLDALLIEVCGSGNVETSTSSMQMRDLRGQPFSPSRTPYPEQQKPFPGQTPAPGGRNSSSMSLPNAWRQNTQPRKNVLRKD